MSVMPKYFAPKLPAEVELRAIDWASALSAGDSILTSTWSVSPAGLNLSSPSFAGTVARVQVSSGVSGVIYELQNTVFTAQGFTLVELVPLTVV